MLQTAVNLAIFYCAAVATASLALHLTTDWRETAVGRVLALLFGAFVVTFGMLTARVALGDAEWFHVARVLAFAVLVPVALTCMLGAQVHGRIVDRRDERRHQVKPNDDELELIEPTDEERAAAAEVAAIDPWGDHHGDRDRDPDAPHPWRRS